MSRQEDKEKDICQHCKHYWIDFRVTPEKVYIACCDVLINKRGWRVNMDEVVSYPCEKCPFDSYEFGKNECRL